MFHRINNEQFFFQVKYKISALKIYEIYVFVSCAKCFHFTITRRKYIFPHETLWGIYTRWILKWLDQFKQAYIEVYLHKNINISIMILLSNNIPWIVTWLNLAYRLYEMHLFLVIFIFFKSKQNTVEPQLSTKSSN